MSNLKREHGVFFYFLSSHSGVWQLQAILGKQGNDSQISPKISTNLHIVAMDTHELFSRI